MNRKYKPNFKEWIMKEGMKPKVGDVVRFFSGGRQIGTIEEVRVFNNCLVDGVVYGLKFKVRWPARDICVWMGAVDMDIVEESALTADERDQLGIEV